MKAANLAISPTFDIGQIGVERCVIATLTDTLGLPLQGVRIDLKVDGISTHFFAFYPHILGAAIAKEQT